MEDLADLLKQWRVADARALTAERAVADALMSLAQGKGTGPTEEMASVAAKLRRKSNEALQGALMVVKK